ncbi:LysR family transcriptional regulator [Mycolicibacterium chitae]|uniref:Probable hydrogen peroxide-inducible genes activator n=1 Tax=Mycolicibacterium chitae TaxID=1792 RepID=A0A448I7Y4_MYCCI|nr:LysR family transcriptional regulator [Mycolicibacterium chitae]
MFRAVVRAGSLSAAAATLNYTTSAVSQQIAALERELGVILLVRGHAGARPTTAGERLYDSAAEILAAIERAERRLDSPDTPELLRVASFASAAATILPTALAELRSAEPRLRPALVAADPDDGVALLSAGDVEAAVITEVPGERTAYPEVVSSPIYDDEFLLVLPPRHRLAGHAEIPLTALAAEDWVVSSATGVCPDARVFQNACRSVGFTPRVAFHSEDYPTLQGLVAADLGVSLVPSLAAAHVRPNVAIRRVAGMRPVRRIALATQHRPEAGTVLGALLSSAQAVGTRLANDSAYRVSERPFSVA